MKVKKKSPKKTTLKCFFATLPNSVQCCHQANHLLSQLETRCEYPIDFNKLMITEFEKPERPDGEKNNFVASLFPVQVYNYILCILIQ